MKKLLLLSFTALLLTACGSEEATSVESTGTIAEPVDTATESVTSEPIVTSDPLEAGNKNGGFTAYNRGNEVVTIKEHYTNEDTDEDGFNTLSFEGYEVKYAIALIESESEEDMLGVFVETENNTDDDIQFNMDMEFVTDTQDQVETEDGIGGSKPGVKLKGFNYAYLEYGVPESFTVTIEPPFKDMGEGSNESGHYGDAVELEFSKE